MHNSPCINLHNPKMIWEILDVDKNLHKCKQYLFYLKLNGKGALILPKRIYNFCLLHAGFV